MGLCIFWFVALLKSGSNGVQKVSVGIGLDCLGYPFLKGPFNTSSLLLLMLGEIVSLLTSAVGRGFGGGPFLDFGGSMQLLVSSHVRSRDKALLRGILSGDVWNGFLISKVRGENVPCRFCGGVDGDGHLFWDCTFPPLVHIRESPEFSSIVNLDKSNWPRCILWHGWLPALSGSTFGNPWAEDATRIAKNQLETALGSYVDAHRHPFDDFRLGERDFDIRNGPFVWSDGSLVVDKVSWGRSRWCRGLCAYFWCFLV